MFINSLMRLMYGSWSKLEHLENNPQQPFSDPFTEGSNFFFLSLWLTYLSNPRSDFEILRPP
jgi:hypothetical protein